MPDINQIQVAWSGTGVVGAATSTFWTDQAHAAAAVTALDQFFSVVRNYLPSGSTINIPNTGKVYDEATGVVRGMWTAGAASSRNGQGVAPFSSASGGLLRLNTGTTVGRRLLRGHIFLVPLSGEAYTAGGQINTSAQGAIATAAASLLTANGDFLFRLWHRPKNGAGGVAAFVSSSSVPAKVAVLRSRRD